MRRSPLAIAFILLGAAVAVLSAAASGGAQNPDGKAPGELRLTLAEFDFAHAHGGGTGTSGVSGIQTLVLKGDPDTSGLYTILLKIPPNTRIRAHHHPDERVATVVAGVWNFGYGDRFAAERLKPLPPGSFYTEPAGRAHFAQTQEGEVLLMITGMGPSGLHYTEEPH